MLSSQVSEAIDSLRFPMAVLVIICHAGFFSRPSGEMIEVWDSWHVLIGMQLFFSEVLPHVAVPLFMLFSGVLLFKNGVMNFEGYVKALYKRVRTLLIPYLIWNSICFVFAIFEGHCQPTFMHWAQGLWDTALWNPETTFSINLPGYPMSMPLWFLRDLMILVLLSYPIVKLLQLTRGWLLLLIAIWWFPDHGKFFGFGADSLFYFSVGAWFGIRQIDFINLLRKMRTGSYTIALIMLCVDALITYNLYIENGELQFLWIPFNLFVVSMMAATLNLAADWQTTRVQEILQKLSPSSFFLFAAHIVFLYQIQKWLYGLLEPDTQLGNMLFYWFFIIIYIIMLTETFFLLKHISPRTVNLITGGRIEQSKKTINKL